MITLSASVCVEAPTDEVWARLAKLEDIALWSETVRAARCDGAIARGVGAERTCDLAGGITITERWTSWEEGVSFTYEGFGIPLVKHARNHWAVEADGEKTLLTSYARVVLKGGRLSRLLEPVLAIQFRRMGPRTLAAFKYLVENGEAPSAKHARLPHPSAC